MQDQRTRDVAAWQAVGAAPGGCGSGWLDEEGALLAISPGFAALTGYGARRLYDTRLEDLLGLACRASFRRALADATDGVARRIGVTLFVHGAPPRPVSLELARGPGDPAAGIAVTLCPAAP